MLMQRELRILILEDETADAELAERELRKSSLVFHWQRATTREQFLAALETGPDLILADYHLPGFDGVEALDIARHKFPEVPFIFVTGAMGEELAIEMLHQGAADYVLKGHLSKLGPAVNRALRAADESRMRQQAELALAESEEQFRNMADTAQDGILIIDQDGLLTYWNRAAERLFGYSREEVLNRDMHQLLAPSRHLDAYRQGWAEFRRSGTGKVIGQTMEMQAINKAGQEFPVELSISAASIKRTWHSVGIVRDISDRRRAEAMRNEYAAIVEYSDDGIFGTTLDGTITSWNKGAERIYGYSAGEMIGQRVSILAAPERLDEIEVFLRRMHSGESITHYETQCLCKDGRIIDVWLTVSAIRDANGTPVATSSIVRDVTERKAGERALQRSNRFLKTLSRCNETLIHATDQYALLNQMCRVVVEGGGFLMAWVGLVQHDAERSILPVAKFGQHAADYVDQLQLTWADTARGGGPTGRAVRTGQIQSTPDMLTAPEYALWHDLTVRCGYRSSVALPLTVDDTMIGTLNIYSGEVATFSQEEVGILAELAADLAFGIATIRMRNASEESARRLGKSLEDTIQAIAATIEARDPYTAGHQKRVAQLAVAIARTMGLEESRVIGIERGAVIHDIGKIYVPSEILSRPGRLGPHEFGLIEAHPQVGYDIVKDIDFPWPIGLMILQHHERLDGRGYPNGLKGEEISLEARIIAVADVIDAMVSHRPYRPALGIDQALAEICENSGRLYDPAVVAACVKLFEQNYVFPPPAN